MHWYVSDVNEIEIGGSIELENITLNYLKGRVAKSR
jgi:hypothetical protein